MVLRAALQLRIAQGLGALGEVAVEVVAELGALVMVADDLIQAAELIVDPEDPALEGGRRIIGLLLGAVAGVVQGLVDVVAEAVVDVGQAPGGNI